ANKKRINPCSHEIQNENGQASNGATREETGYQTEVVAAATSRLPLPSAESRKFPSECDSPRSPAPLRPSFGIRPRSRFGSDGRGAGSGRGTPYSPESQFRHRQAPRTAPSHTRTRRDRSCLW